MIAHIHTGGLPWCFSGKESTCNAGAMGDTGSIPGSGRSLEEGIATYSSILACKSHGQRSLAGHSLWSLKELDMLEQPSTRTFIQRNSINPGSYLLMM